jgi:hypothetical protein
MTRSGVQVVFLNQKSPEGAGAFPFETSTIFAQKLFNTGDMLGESDYDA